MRRVSAFLLASCLLIACARERPALTRDDHEQRRLTRMLRDTADETERWLTRLARFEQRTLVPFDSDAALQRYLEALAFVMSTTRGETPYPPLPVTMDHPLRPTRPGRDEAAHRAHALSWAEPSMRPVAVESTRLARRGDHVFWLAEHELRGFVLSGDADVLQPSTRFAVCPPVPRPSEKTTVDARGRARVTRFFEPDALAGIARFDHVFVDGDRALVVVGRRVDVQALEVVRLIATPNGSFTRSGALTLYYRPTDLGAYEARWVDGGLVVHLVHDPLHDAPPSVPSWSESGGTPRPLLRGRDVHRPLYHSEANTNLDTLVRCTLAPDIRCTARALATSAASASVVADDGVYAWFADWMVGEGRAADAFLYRMPFDGTSPTAARTRPLGAQPVLSVEAGTLHGLLTVPGERAVALLEVPTSQLSSRVAPLASLHYRVVPGVSSDDGGEPHTMRVGKHWILERANVGFHDPVTDPWIDVVSRETATVTRVMLGHDPGPLVGLGDRVLVMGDDGWHLHMSLVALSDGPPRVVAKHVLRDAARTVRGYHGGVRLGSAGEQGCVATDVQYEDAQGRTVLPLAWSGSMLAARTPWEVPRTSSLALSLQHGRDVLALNDDLTLIRMQGELLAVRCAPEPRIVQRVPLVP